MDSLLVEDHRHLQQKYSLLEKELDEKNQKLYDCQRKLKESEVLRINEVELLQAELDSNNSNKLTLQISQMKETILELRLANAKKTNSLENELSNKENEITTLKKELNECRSKDESLCCVKDDSELFEELSVLRRENDILQGSVEELQQHLKEVGDHILRLEEELNVCRTELEETRECLSVKTASLKETHEVIEKLNDELKCTKDELDTYVNKPLDQGSKGNSLFAEVDDRRKYLQKTIDSMKTDYIAMKQERHNHMKQIAHLRREISDISQNYKTDVEQIEIDKFEIDKAVKERIEILEKLLENIKHEKKQKEKSNNLYEEMQYYSNIIKQKEQQIEEMQQKLSSQAFNHVVLSKALAEANHEKRKWKREATLIKNKCDLEEAEKSLESETAGEKWQQSNKGPILPNLNTLKQEREKINFGLHTPYQHTIFQNSRKLQEPMNDIKKSDHIDNKILPRSGFSLKELVQPTKAASFAVSVKQEPHNVTNKENESPLVQNSSIKIENDLVEETSASEIKIDQDGAVNSEIVKTSKSVSFAHGLEDSSKPVKATIRRIPKNVIKSKPVHVSTKNLLNNAK